MPSLCPVCRTEVPLGGGTLLKAGRKPLAVVHPQCATVAQQGVALLGKMVLAAGGFVLEQRAPGLMAAFRTVQRTLKRSTRTTA